MKNLITCLAAGALSSATFATTWTVDDDGKADFDSLQAALDDVLVVDGDEILVMPGTYTSTAPYEVVDMRNKAVWMHSSDGPEFTFIDGETLRRGIHCTGDVEGMTIEGFTIQNCYGHTNGGGMFLDNGAQPTLKNCSFVNNTAEGFGGGILNWHSSPTLTDCEFTDNTAQQGGGIFNWYNNNSTLTNCTFTGNTATDYGGGGMGNNENSSPTLVNCTFTSNTTGNNHGGGGMMNSYSSSPTLTNCTFDGNAAGSRGGGIYNTNSSSPMLENCTFENNIAGGNGGGGMHNEASSPTLTNCTFENNSAEHGGGMDNENRSNSILTNYTFYHPDHICYCFQ